MWALALIGARTLPARVDRVPRLGSSNFFAGPLGSGWVSRYRLAMTTMSRVAITERE